MQTHAYRREEATGMTDDMNAQLTAAGNEMSASFLAAKKRSDETLAKLKANPGAPPRCSPETAPPAVCISATSSAPSASVSPCRISA